MTDVYFDFYRRYAFEVNHKGDGNRAGRVLMASRIAEGSRDLLRRRARKSK